jgi:hypothetical protein
MASGDVILDTSTGLKWARMITSPSTYATATSTCMAWGGRIPTEQELLNFRGPVLMCVGQGKLTWDGPPPREEVWSSTPDPMNASFHMTVGFDSAPANSAPDTDVYWVRCVM